MDEQVKAFASLNRTRVELKLSTTRAHALQMSGLQADESIIIATVLTTNNSYTEIRLLSPSSLKSGAGKLVLILNYWRTLWPIHFPMIVS